jgi:hypothetical protein
MPGAPSRARGSEGDNGAGSRLIHVVILLVSTGARPTRHLRLLAQLATMLEDGGFAERWQRAHDEQELLDALVRRGNRTIVPHGDALVRAVDRPTVIGAADDVAALHGEGADEGRAG